MNKCSYEKETTINESGSRKHIKIREVQSYSQYDDFVVSAHWEDGELKKVEIKGWYIFQPEVTLSAIQVEYLVKSLENGLLNLRSGEDKKEDN